MILNVDIGFGIEIMREFVKNKREYEKDNVLLRAIVLLTD